ncbi:hypothetical protein L596_004345 [Steinernema carpocapsae]|uniref:Uncharacterized protein n=1 Tax=Steinernema carpocapsae TaxID=34508 RepID=A0A4U8UX47_STECR|nr:hypothetical protein L596_004345 [Steinernema carpocapsae]
MASPDDNKSAEHEADERNGDDEQLERALNVVDSPSGNSHVAVELFDFGILLALGENADDGREGLLGLGVVVHATLLPAVRAEELVGAGVKAVALKQK